MSYQSLSPKLISEIHPERNVDDVTSLAKLSAGSNRKIWWLGDCSHEWEAQIRHRHNGGGCPYCAGQKTLKGFNDLATKFPLIASEWSVTRNKELQPEMVTSASAKIVWWQCQTGHEWKATVKSRTLSGSGCPSCYKEKVAVFRNLTEDFPEIASQWDHGKNQTRLDAHDLRLETKVWWKCPKGHSWQTSIGNRIKGSGCHTCAKIKSGKTRRIPVQGNSLAERFPLLLSSWDYEKNSILPEEVNWGSSSVCHWLCPEGHEWVARVSDRTSLKSNCPFCAHTTSAAEEKIAVVLTQAGLSVERNTRKVIPPYELDLYIPEKNIAIEYNGVYWHSEANGKDKWYHHKKWAACKEKGIQLIQIWEDDWNRNPELIKRMLLHKLGVTSEKVAARKTTAVQLSRSEAKTFLDANHIQQNVDGSHRYGLLFGEVLVAVILLKDEPGTNGTELNLLRYATSVPVLGGFTKLLKHIKQNISTASAIITFSDHSVSDGGLYRDNGFLPVREIEPDYMYLVGGERQHKFNFRKARFKADPNLLYNDEMTEAELATANNLPRVWDSGKTKWKLTWS
jgi:hypothetical protein